MSPALRFLVDANVLKSVVRCLRDLGHDVRDVRDILPHATADPALFRTAQDEERILVTHDLGFANIIAYPPGSHAGIYSPPEFETDNNRGDGLFLCEGA